jgi:hypothetical protein
MREWVETELLPEAREKELSGERISDEIIQIMWYVSCHL